MKIKIYYRSVILMLVGQLLGLLVLPSFVRSGELDQNSDTKAVALAGDQEDVEANFVGNCCIPPCVFLIERCFACVTCLKNCFHGENTIQTKHGKKLLKHVNINDQVLSLDESSGRFRYDTVIFDLHHSPLQPAKFVEISTAMGKKIMLTNTHYLYTGCSLSEMRAVWGEAVRVGDAVMTRSSGGRMWCEQVTSINRSVPAVGVYNPVLARGGTIVVGGVLASVYASPGARGVVTPRAAHWALWAMRHIGRGLAPYPPPRAVLTHTGSGGVLLWARYMDILRGYAHALLHYTSL